MLVRISSTNSLNTSINKLKCHTLSQVVFRPDCNTMTSLAQWSCSLPYQHASMSYVLSTGRRALLTLPFSSMSRPENLLLNHLTNFKINSTASLQVRYKSFQEACTFPIIMSQTLLQLTFVKLAWYILFCSKLCSLSTADCGPTNRCQGCDVGVFK